jgi:membrane associated rhomboid family serine protease
MLTPWVTIIILANAAIYLLQSTPLVNDLAHLALVPFLIPVQPWTLVTYMFLHQGWMHVFFNMLSLYFFGPRVEAQLSGGKFAALYFSSGIAGGLLSWVFTPGVAIVGASGGVLGVMCAYAWFWPRDQILLWFVPLEAWLAVLVMGALDLFGVGAGVAHFAHLGGAGSALLFLSLFGRSAPPKNRFEAKLKTPRVSRSDIARWSKIRREELHAVNREELDRIMEKIETQGVGTVTPQERVFLDTFSERYGG